MSATIRKLEPKEIEKAAEMMAFSYIESPSIAAFSKPKNHETRFKVLKSYFRILLEQTMRYGKVEAIVLDKELVGAGMYYPPNQWPVPKVARIKTSLRVLASIGIHIGLKNLLELTNIVSVLEKLHPAQPYYYAQFGCVIDKYQKTGIARLMLENLFQQADRERVGIYGESSSETNTKIWKKIGFKVVHETNVQGVIYTSLWREPAALVRRFDNVNIY